LLVALAKPTKTDTAEVCSLIDASVLAASAVWSAFILCRCLLERRAFGAEGMVACRTNRMVNRSVFEIS